MEDSILIPVIIFGAFVGGMVGAVLGRIARKTEQGWWLGFFLGPIGWVIVFLLPRHEQRESVAEVKTGLGGYQSGTERPPRERNLSLDSYKIWLVKSYGIERNEALGQFICNDQLFPSLEEALRFADSIERAKLARMQQAHEESEQEVGEQDSYDNRLVIGLVLFVALACAGLIFIGFVS